MSRWVGGARAFAVVIVNVMVVTAHSENVSALRYSLLEVIVESIVENFVCGTYGMVVTAHSEESKDKYFVNSPYKKYFEKDKYFVNSTYKKYFVCGTYGMVVTVHSEESKKKEECTC